MSQFLKFLAEAREPIDQAIDALVPSSDVSPERLHEAMRYSLFAGGKRVRPTLVLLAAEALGLPREDVLPGAAALEMIHTFSLMHDDLPALDNDDLRRGRPAAHKQFDEATAILGGDALLALAMTILATRPATMDPERRVRAVALVGEAVGTTGMIGGQVDDMAFGELPAGEEWPEDASDRLETIHRRKTGALLTASLRLAGIYGGVHERVDDLLRELGDAVGLLFQIGDDILDVEGTSETLGKTAGKDAAQHKLTYPGLYGLEESKRMLRDTRDHAHRLVGELLSAEPPSADAVSAKELWGSLIEFLCTRDR